MVKKNLKPNGMVSLQRDLIKKKLKDKDLFLKVKTLEKKVKKHDKSEKYILNRSFQDYNFIFENISISNSFKMNSVFKKNIILTLMDIELKNKRKELNVLDDGAGKGLFLSELKKKWNYLKKEKLVSADLKTTAVSLTNTLSSKNIDFKEIGNVLKFLPKRKYDFIISVYGGFHYTQTILKKEVLLKYLYSLNKNGIAIFSIKPVLLNTVVNRKYREQIIRSLEKRGFLAEFTYIPQENKINNKNIPNVYLIVERII